MAQPSPTTHFSDIPLTSSHTNNFDLIRYLLAVLVILSHSFPLLYGTNDHEFLWVFSRGQYTGGSLAVDLFLIISGFLVTQSWTRSNGPLHFLTKRIRRIYPGYIGVVLVSLLLVWVLDDVGKAFLRTHLREPSFWLRIFSFTIPPIPQFLASNPYPMHINGSLWTIMYECACYLLLVLLGLLGAIRKRQLMLGLFLVFWAVYMLGILNSSMDFDAWPYRLNYWVRMISCFLAGVSFYLYRHKIPFSGRYALISMIASVTLCVIGYGFVPTLPILGAYSVFYLAFSRYVPGYSFGQRGDLSYGVYLYAFPVQQVLVHVYKAYLSPLSLFVSAWSVTVLCAWLSWSFIEGPALQRKG